MEEIVKFLENNKYGSLATSVDDQPYVRPFEYGFKSEDGIFFYTSKDKGVYSQLKSNPKASFCVTGKDDSTYVELTGNIKFTNDEKYKNMMLEKSNNARKIYGSSDNENFEVFYMSHGRASMHESSSGYVSDDQF
ncbi:pyridoxamine 5'-phosphate oxidase family protein [Anaerovorax odorimutans]|uniref:pyridoxamine 5'-phosphate oxidase family protein n=1 Tax=Anaerovorax odorimutans TaxID=109327 RepID=UPI00042176EF|nr:pyridoxamine 5'-phosphate oxidase family protein [Anaerovorax odorimutans]